MARESRYIMSICDRETAETVYFEPGLSVEIDFVEECVKEALGRGVGVLRTEAHVEKAIRDGIRAAIRKLKKRVRP